MAFTQDNRPISVSTPLGKDVLLLEEFFGTEKVSDLFRFHMSMLAEDKKNVEFDKILGQGITVAIELPGNKKRFFHGIVSSISQGGKVSGGPGAVTFIRYRAEVVPQLWTLTKKVQSRIFQNITVPNILKKVLAGIDSVDQIQGTFEPRDYCVQYRESDFAFASRLMEEEGIYYYFKHADGSHKMVVANTPQSHEDVPGPTKIIYEEMVGGNIPEDRVYSWEKNQQVRAGKYTLWDHCFEMPDKTLEATKEIQDAAPMGAASHKLKVGGNDKMEIYDYPGGYAQRFDGVDAGGGVQAANLGKIEKDNARTVEIRMQEETLPSLLVRGDGACRHFMAGHKFTLERHFSANGAYVLTEVHHEGSIVGGYTSPGVTPLQYKNTFQCIPVAVPFRPARATPRPVVHGTQTALVVGRSGDEIFTDKYGRVKVQFPWDREGKKDAKSSCWVRVATPWAGKQWGMIHIPRIGHEVVVAFEEGDPDRPIIVGSVYNANNMPPYKLPDNMTQSGIVTRSTLKGTEVDFNELCFEDKKGEEFIYLRAQKDYVITVENDEVVWIGHDNWIEVDNDETTTIKGNRKEEVGKDEEILIKGKRTEEVQKDESILIGGSRTEEVKKDESIIIKGKRTTEITKDDSTKISGDSTTKCDKNVTIEATQSITFKVGSNSITIDMKGVVISGTKTEVTGTASAALKGAKVDVTADAALTLAGPICKVG